MRRHTRLYVLAIVLILAAVAVPAATASHLIVPVSPPAGGIIAESTPLIEASFNQSIDPASIRLYSDGEELTGQDLEIVMTANNVSYQFPSYFALQPGNHTIRVMAGGESLTWTYKIDPNYVPPRDKGVDMLLAVVLVAGALVALAGAGLAGTYVYLRRVKGYSWEKFTVKFPVRRAHIVLALPLFFATLGLLGGLSYFSTHELKYSTEYVLVATLVVGLAPYALDVRRAKRRRRAYEKAFTQFLYELADAMRGGIDPYKAIQELARTDNSVLKRSLGQAADSIRLGRPLDAVMRTLARASTSSLVERYAALVGEAATAGGEVASVVYRAAKDLDELVRIDRERSAKMTGPIVTVYISFGVLLMITQSMLSFAPALEQFGNSAAAEGGLGSLLSMGGGDVPKMTLAEMQANFFHVLLANALGAGLIIGSFTEGKVRHGLLHVVILVSIAAVGFPLFTQ